MLLVEHFWQKDDPLQIELAFLPLWIQVHGLPTSFMLDGVAKHIGDRVGSFLESDPNNYNNPWRTIMRIQVRLDVRKLLKKGVKLKLEGSSSSEVVLKYERLPSFCFVYSKLGHGERFCPKVFESEDGSIVGRFRPEL